MAEEEKKTENGQDEAKNIEFNAKALTYVKPEQSADALFSFMPKFEYLAEIVERRKMYARYCIEPIEYLQIPEMTQIAYPMKCFCDINLHRIGEHMKWYGGYGIAFGKEWCIHNGIQPVWYINPESEVRKSFTQALIEAIHSAEENEEKFEKTLWHIFNTLMFVKPCQGKTKIAHSGEMKEKCLADECEWRFTVDVDQFELPQIVYENDKLTNLYLSRHSDALKLRDECALKFEWKDIKHIIVPTEEEFDQMAEKIMEVEFDGVNSADKYRLIGKMSVWNRMEGDI